MTVEAVRSGDNPCVQNTNSDGDDAVQLQRQMEILQKQLETVKSNPKNSQVEQDSAVRQMQVLKNKISEIQQKI